MTNHQLTGNEGEELAAGWLQRKGFVLLHRNWRYSYYEVDIIAHFNNVLHFIEVKTRRNKKFGEPEEAVDDKKIMRLMEAGEAFSISIPTMEKGTVRCFIHSVAARQHTPNIFL